MLLISKQIQANLNASSLGRQPILDHPRLTFINPLIIATVQAFHSRRVRSFYILYSDLGLFAMSAGHIKSRNAVRRVEDFIGICHLTFTLYFSIVFLSRSKITTNVFMIRTYDRHL